MRNAIIVPRLGTAVTFLLLHDPTRSSVTSAKTKRVWGLLTSSHLSLSKGPKTGCTRPTSSPSAKRQWFLNVGLIDLPSKTPLIESAPQVKDRRGPSSIFPHVVFYWGENRRIPTATAWCFESLTGGDLDSRLFRPFKRRGTTSHS